MNGILNVYKPPCVTPYQSIKYLRSRLHILTETKIGYAGRLDPLASGVLLLMLGEECKKRDIYQNHDKKYRFDLTFGIRTDSLDPLGIVQADTVFSEIDKDRMRIVLKKFIGEINQKYPLYSSYAINGVPMFKLAREGAITDADRPIKSVNIKALSLIDLQRKSLKDYADGVIERVNRIEGHFRQTAVIDSWKRIKESNQIVQIATIEADVSTGTYIRSLAEDISKELNTFGIADNIIRTSVGKYTLDESLRL